MEEKSIKNIKEVVTNLFPILENKEVDIKKIEKLKEGNKKILFYL